MAPLGQWILLGEEERLKTPVFTAIDRRCLSPKDGREKTFACLAAPQWANVLALTSDGLVPMVRQFRHGSREESLELPGGVVEPGQSPEETARRELMEETGYQASSFELLCALRPNPAIMDNTIFTYLAKGAEPTGRTDFDENEELELLLVPEAELRGMILDGRVDHAMMVAAIGFYLAKGR
jgi:8-oxo-dGTP pyrophosphatase MutT (NUDIX family)